MKALFEEYEIHPLRQALQSMAEKTERAGIDAAEMIGRRRSALEAYERYPHRDPAGRPLAPAVTEPDYQNLIDIEITATEAHQLGLPSSIAVRQHLLQLTKEEIIGTAHGGISRKSLAHYLLETGPKNFTRYNAYVAETSARQKTYEQAMAAYRFLSQPDRTDTDSAEKHQKAKILLQKIGAVSRPILLLSRDEYTHIIDGRFTSDMDAVFDPAEQKKRRRVNECVQKSYKKDGKIPFVAVLDPDLMKKVERVIHLDDTASWLLGFVNEQELPIIFFRYLESDIVLMTQDVEFGTYVHEYQTISKAKVWRIVEVQLEMLKNGIMDETDALLTDRSSLVALRESACAELARYAR